MDPRNRKLLNPKIKIKKNIGVNPNLLTKKLKETDQYKDNVKKKLIAGLKQLFGGRPNKTRKRKRKRRKKTRKRRKRKTKRIKKRRRRRSIRRRRRSMRGIRIRQIRRRRIVITKQEDE